MNIVETWSFRRRQKVLMFWRNFLPLYMFTQLTFVSRITTQVQVFNSRSLSI